MGLAHQPGMNELQGKVAVVTGGCGDIGFTTVKRFLGAGAKVLVMDRLQADVDAAIQANVRATPSYEVGGVVKAGEFPFELLPPVPGSPADGKR